MTDHEFLTAMGIQSVPGDEDRLTGGDSLAEALRIDDARSAYCEQLEARLAEQARDIQALRQLLDPDVSA